jgi:hypothetical protein
MLRVRTSFDDAGGYKSVCREPADDACDRRLASVADGRGRTEHFDSRAMVTRDTRRFLLWLDEDLPVQDGVTAHR